MRVCEFAEILLGLFTLATIVHCHFRNVQKKALDRNKLSLNLSKTKMIIGNCYRKL